MPHLRIFILICLMMPAQSLALNDLAISIDNSFNFERIALDGMSLGDDPGEDRQIEQAIELETAIEYSITDKLFVFLNLTLIDEKETIKTVGLDEQASGIERNQIGMAYLFGDAIDATLKFGRSEFTSESEWWVWWDESLDAISLETSYADVETLLAIAEEQAREFTADDFIDPEIEGLRRILFSAAWEFTDHHSLLLYYLDQTDRSATSLVGEMIDYRKIDESDADISWSGLSYLGAFDVDKVGDFEIELHSARVSGTETVYQFDDPVLGLSEVTDSEKYRVSGSAQAGLLKWRPSFARDFRLLVGTAQGSGDRNLDDMTDGSFRLSGLQGDDETFGELFQPELANLEVDLVGLEWQLNTSSRLALINYRYRQRYPADEMRDTAFEVDPSGSSSQLGKETDLVLTLQGSKGIEWIIKLAEFEAGKAYLDYPRQTVNYLSIELDVEF